MSETTPEPQDRVEFSVGGRTFVTTESTLNIHPESMLAALVRFQKQNPASTHSDHHSSPPSSRTIFIDRSPDLFSVVLEYYRTNNLHIPQGGPSLAAVRAEAEYFGLSHLGVLAAARLTHDTEIVCCTVNNPDDWAHFERVQVIRIPADDSSLPTDPDLRDNWGASLFRFRYEALLVFHRVLAERVAEEDAKNSGCTWRVKYLAVSTDGAQPNATTRFYFVIQRAVAGEEGGVRRV
ncbi:BTB/POZ domain-containing protein kctd16 [Rhizophlyctis rosea]|nr:BTB/POZ domain-containing protein kctd16 [Rhizophlyctis rosea]